MSDILVADGQMVRAFEAWDRRFRLDPKAFVSDVERLLKGQTSTEYGQACAEWFKTLLVENR